MKQNRKNGIHPHSKLMLFSLITILFVTIRIVIDICSFIPHISADWSNYVWTTSSSMLLVFNIIALVFAFLESRIADGKHKVMMWFIIGMLIFTLIIEIVWWLIDLLSACGYDSWNKVTLINDLHLLTIITIGCDLVAIPSDVISTCLISKTIKE